MQTLKHWLLAAATLALCACGGSDNTLVSPPGGTGSSSAASLTLLTSSPQMPSDGSANATITALVRDASNNVIADQSVVFTASSGALVVSTPSTTDKNGVLTATLSTAGDPTNRAITVSGMSGNASSSVTVNVVGTALALNGPSSLPQGTSQQYNVVLTDAGAKGIGGKVVTITSSKANGLSQTQLVTDSKGNASFTLTGNNGGADTVTASALGIQATQPVNVSTDAFAFTAPPANTEVTLGSNVIVTVNWKQGSAAVPGRPISFSTTRGTLSTATGCGALTGNVVNTDGAGNACVSVSANNAGPAVITATNDAGTSTQLAIEFVATVPAVLDLQAEPFTIGTNGQSALTATVRDAGGNLVKNQTINFKLTDVTGGSLSVAQAVTNSQGQAKTFYNASNTTSAVDGVSVDATVASTPAVTDAVQITVAQRQVFISFGTGNEIIEANPAQYRTQWIIQVTDAQGNGVSGADVSLSILTRRYWEGTRTFSSGPPAFWATNALPGGLAGGCPDEDINHNGVLDTNPHEDLNNNGKIEAGNILTVTPDAGTGSTATTDKNGFALFSVYYPQQYAYWLEVILTAKLTVQGTEFSESTVFVPPGSASDFSSQTNAPPGVVSPFGSDGICATPPPPDGP